jgi:excisionase family DNA binding protein
MHTSSSAARATGVAKSTIYRAIKTGRLSAHKLSSGNYAIYPAELRRILLAAPPRAARVVKPNSFSFPMWDVG